MLGSNLPAWCALMFLLPIGSVRDVTAKLPPGVAPEAVRVEYLPDGSKKASPCTFAGRSGGDPMYECDFEPGAQSAGVFVFRMAGYQLVTVRAASLQPLPGEVAIHLGSIHAANSDEPRIDKVAKTVDADGSVRFDIAANNQSRHSITVSAMQMGGSYLRSCGVRNPGSSAQSRMPPNPITRFAITDRLLLKPEGSAGIRATIADGDTHPEYPIAVTGRGESSPCSETSFRLSAPAKFVVPPGQVFSVELLFVPGHTAAVVGGFDKIVFAFLTTDKDYPGLRTTYSK
jgi:hypothetical protein